MKNLITLLFIFSAYISIQAAHIIGGTVEYTINSVVGDEIDMDVTFHVYSDALSNGAGFDSNIIIGLYGTSGNVGTGYNLIQETGSTVENIQPIDFSDILDCLPATISAQSGEYKVNFVFNLNDDQNFIIAYQRCCRFPLVNILQGEETGIALTLDITRAGMEREGEVKSFRDVFPFTIAPSEMKTFDFAIEDGLTKIYSLTDAFTAGGEDGVLTGDANSCTGITPSPQACPPPFVGPLYKVNSGDYGLYNEVAMDSISGEFVSGLTAQGSYLIAVKADSYDDQELLSTVYQQFVQIVSMCDPNSVISEDRDHAQEIYPVPAQDLIYIGIPLTDIIIYNAKGTRLITKSVFNAETGIDVSDLSVGVYFLEGFTENSIKITKRFVK